MTERPRVHVTPPAERQFWTVLEAVRWAIPARVAVPAIDPAAPIVQADWTAICARSADRAAIIACLTPLREPGRTALLVYAYGLSVKKIARLLKRRDEDVGRWLDDAEHYARERLSRAGYLRGD